MDSSSIETLKAYERDTNSGEQRHVAEIRKLEQQIKVPVSEIYFNTDLIHSNIQQFLLTHYERKKHCMLKHVLLNVCTIHYIYLSICLSISC